MFTGQRRLEKQVESLQSGDIRILCMHCVLIWRPGFYYDIHGAVASSTRDNEEVLKTCDKRLVTLENTIREISNRIQFSSRLVEGEPLGNSFKSLHCLTNQRRAGSRVEGESPAMD